MAYVKSGGIVKFNVEGVKPWEAAVLFVAGAVLNLAIAGGALMFLLRIVYDNFGLLAPIGFVTSVILILLTIIVLAMFQQSED